MKCEPACPLTEYGMGIGKVIRKLAEGKESDLINSAKLWNCLMCFRCDDSCPSDFRPREGLMELRRKSRMHDAYLPLLNNLRETGHALSHDRKKVKEICELLK